MFMSDRLTTNVSRGCIVSPSLRYLLLEKEKEKKKEVAGLVYKPPPSLSPVFHLLSIIFHVT